MPGAFLGPQALVAQSILEIPAASPGLHIAYGSGEFQFGELYMPEGKGPHPVAIVIHGGYWRARYDLRHIGHFCIALARAGMAAWSLEYRRLGNAGGGFPGTFDDVRAGAEYLEKIGAPFIGHAASDCDGAFGGRAVGVVAGEAKRGSVARSGAAGSRGGSEKSLGIEAERHGGRGFSGWIARRFRSFTEKPT